MTPLDKMPPKPIHYTPCEKRILKVLEDGERHQVSELMKCLNDELTQRSTLSDHILHIRRKLPVGEYIVCEISHYKTYYRHVILLSSRQATLSLPSPQNGSSHSQNGSIGGQNGSAG